MLTHGNWSITSINNLTVSGSDKDWVAATFSDLEGLLNSIKSTMRPYSFVRILIAITSFFSAKMFISWLFFDVISSIMIFLASLLFAFFISFVVKELFPSIEFDFGPGHFRATKKRRIALGVVSVIFIPYLINFLPTSSVF